MKLSKLISLCNKAIERYGDMTVGVYSKDYAYELDEENGMYCIKFRVISEKGSLPGESFGEDTEDSEGPRSRYACIFYED